MHEVEESHKRVHQRTIGLIKLLGELYNYSAISSTLVFDLLHFLVKYVRPAANDGSSASLLLPRVGSDNDFSSDCFRIQLVVELLSATGSYFVHGAAKDRLNRFLALFQRFLLSKPGLPMHIEFSVLDLYDTLEEMARKAAVKRIKKSAPKRKEQDIEDSLVGPFFPRYDSLGKASFATMALLY